MAKGRAPKNRKIIMIRGFFLRMPVHYSVFTRLVQQFDIKSCCQGQPEWVILSYS